MASRPPSSSVRRCSRFPAPWRRRLAGLVAGLLAIQALNLVRVVSLFWIGAHRPALFSASHTVLWQSAVVLASVLLFLFWAAREREGSRRRSSGAAWAVSAPARRRGLDFASTDAPPGGWRRASPRVSPSGSFSRRPTSGSSRARAEAAAPHLRAPRGLDALGSGGGEIRVERSDFPPASPRPGLPAADLHFNFVLLAALFALESAASRAAALCPVLARRRRALPHPRHGARLPGRSALCDAARPLERGALRNRRPERVGARGFHFYQIAGRFAAPFALWWGFSESRDALTAG